MKYLLYCLLDRLNLGLKSLYSVSGISEILQLKGIWFDGTCLLSKFSLGSEHTFITVTSNLDQFGLIK